MKAIIESYGTSIMTALTILAIITLLSIIPDGRGNVGIFQIIASGSDFDNDLYENMSDTLATLEVYSKTDTPVVSLNKEYHFMSNHEIVLGDGFIIHIANKATDYKLSETFTSEAQTFGFDVIALTAEDGNDYLGSYNSSTGKIIFPTAGKYEITIRIYDRFNGKETTNTFVIPVDEGGVI